MIKLSVDGFFFRMDLDLFNINAAKKENENRQFFKKLKASPPRKLDDHFHSAHNEIFRSIDCLKCANCCKTTSPIFYERDIDRASKALRLKPGDFIDNYLRVDEDGDYVLKGSPCPFLDGDNYCSIYSDRPTACREYPHTNRKRMSQVLDLTMNNTMVCPAVLSITEEIKKMYAGK
jgi:uncharacterized protein